MVIHQVYVEGVALFKPENHPPLSADPDGPESGKLASQGMKNKTRGIHIADFLCAMESGQNPPESTCELLGNPASVTRCEKPLKPPMPKALNHLPRSVRRRVTLVKCIFLHGSGQNPVQKRHWGPTP